MSKGSVVLLLAIFGLALVYYIVLYTVDRSETNLICLVITGVIYVSLHILNMITKNNYEQ